MSALRDNGGPAFPRVGSVEDTGDTFYPRRVRPAQDGMSLRDYFAGQALVGLMANVQPERIAMGTGAIAEACHAVADAMLAKRANPAPPEPRR